jgi:hypothetical protein
MRTWKNVGKFWKIGKNIENNFGFVFENLGKSWNNLGNVGGNHEKLEHIGGNHERLEGTPWFGENWWEIMIGNGEILRTIGKILDQVLVK